MSDLLSALKIVVGYVVGVYSGYWGVLAWALADTYARDQRRKAENQARDQFNAGLRDRYQMVQSAVATRRIVYGRARISGPIVYAQSTGTKKEFLHIVVALAGHECDAIESVYFNDILLPAEDGAGLIQSGEFSHIDTITVVEQFTATSFSVSQTVATVQSVARFTQTGTGDGTVIVTEVLALGVGYTRAGSAFTIIDGGGFGTSINVNYTYTVNTPRVRLKKFLGTPTQAASSDLITESGGKWTSAHQLKGVCYLYARLEYDQDVFGQTGLPNISAVVRGKKIFDTRDSVTRWTENAALCVRDYLLDATYGLGVTSAQAPTAETTTAANICDQAVLLYNTGTVTVTLNSPNVAGVGTSWIARVRPGMNFVGPNAVNMTVLSVTSNTALVLTANYTGATLATQAYSINEARYTCNGVLNSADRVRDNLDKLTESMAGTAVWTQGRWLVRAGAHLSSSLTITEDLLGDMGPQIMPRAPRQQLVNRVIPRYAEPQKLYTEMQAPAVTNATYLADDGALDLPTELTYDMCTGGVRAQRLAKIHLERTRQALTVRLSCNLKAYDLSPHDVVALTLSRYGWSAKLFEVLSRKLDVETRQIELFMRETASPVWDWALGAETAVDLTPNTDLPNPFTPPTTLAGLTADSSLANALLLGNGSISPRAKLAWTQSTDVFVVRGGWVDVQFKSDEAVDWTQMPRVAGDASTAYLAPIQGNRLILIRIRPVNSRGRVGAWTTITHQTAVLFNPGSIGGGNLLRNASFEQDINASGTADAWLAYSAGTVSGITRTLPNTGIGGTFAQQVDATSLGATPNTDRMGSYQEVNFFAGLVGLTLGVSAWFTASAQLDFVMQAQWAIDGAALTTDSGAALTFDDGTPIALNAISFSSVTVPNTTSVAIRRAVGNFVVPATASALTLTYYVTPQSGRAASAAFVRMDDAQLEVGAALTAYAPKTDEILAAQVVTLFIAPLAVTTPKIADEAVVAAKIPDAGIPDSKLITINADRLNAGSVRGRNIQGSAHVTKGTFLTAIPATAAATVLVDNTTDFAASGTAIIIDLVNDRDAFTYTAKTSNSFTGCSGVLGGHTGFATVVPLAKGMHIDANTNEMRFYGDRGDGTIEEIGYIGTTIAFELLGGQTLADVILKSGVSSSGADTVGVLGRTNSAVGAVVGDSGGTGAGVYGVSSSSGTGVLGISTTGYGGRFDGNATKANLSTGTPLAARPSSGATGDVAMCFTTGGGVGTRTATPRLVQHDGTNWIFVHDNTTFTG